MCDLLSTSIESQKVLAFLWREKRFSRTAFGARFNWELITSRLIGARTTVPAERELYNDAQDAAVQRWPQEWVARQGPQDLGGTRPLRTRR